MLVYAHFTLTKSENRTVCKEKQAISIF